MRKFSNTNKICNEKRDVASDQTLQKRYRSNSARAIQHWKFAKTGKKINKYLYHKEKKIYFNKKNKIK